MTVPTPELIKARTEAEIARKRFFDTLAEVQDRLAPSTIARNAWDGVRDKGEAVAEQTVEFAREKANQTIDFAIEKPAAAGAIAAGVTAFVIRKPIVRGLRRLFRRRPKSDLPTTSPEPVGAIAARAGDDS